MRRFSLLLALAGLGCPSASVPIEVPPPASPPAPRVAHYELNEWGVVSQGPNGFELAAGPGQHVPAELTVDKPVIYVHSDQALEFELSVHLGSGFALAEHWPLAALQQPLTWPVHVTPGACAQPRHYPRRCTTPDGYCEVAELPLYETPDADCLRSGDTELPLLFYRLRADAVPAMPIEVRREDDAIVVTNRSWRGEVGGLWRVISDPVHHSAYAVRVEIPAVGEQVTIPKPTGSTTPARQEIRRALAQQGLRTSEADAFMRGWEQTLFGNPAVDVDEDGLVDLPVDPNATGRWGCGDGDCGGPPHISNRSQDPALPRLDDTLLYWLPRSDIDGMARIEAQPAPDALHRAILVRVAL